MKQVVKLLGGLTVIIGMSGGMSVPAQAQVDTAKHWYSVFKDIKYGKNGSCTTASYRYVSAPNQYSMYHKTAAPYGFTHKAYRSTTGETGRNMGWCPKSMSASACEKREESRMRRVWHTNAWSRKCLKVYWDGAVIYSK